MKLDITIIGYITTFENVTKTDVKECFYNKNKQLVFIVKEGQGRKAVGKKGLHIRKLERLIKKKIKIIEFNSKVEEFVKNIIFPLKSPEVKLEEDVLKVKTDSMQLKALLLGREKANLKELQEIVGRYFNNVKIVID
ncbi:MAG: NusA-like transcription termination signal-binding factor [Nanoarchaeota archaeon]